MPWTGASFRQKNSSLSAHQAAKAAKQANAVMKSSGDEGLAIAVANKRAGKSSASRLYKHKGYAEGGVVRQTEKERDGALQGYLQKRRDRRGDSDGAKEIEDDEASDKFKVDGGDDGLQEFKSRVTAMKRYQEPEEKEIDVDAEASTKRGQRDFAGRVGEKLRRGDPTMDQNMDTRSRAPGTKDSGVMATLPRKRDAATESIDDEYPEEIELARGGKITQVAGKPIGKDDGLIAAQKGEFVVRKSAVQKLGLEVMNEINKGRLPSQRLYGRKAGNHAA